MVKDLSKFSLSPTKVDTFQKCPRQFYYNYIDQPFPMSEKKWFLIGNIAHKALENFHGPEFVNVQWQKLMGKAFKDAVKTYHAHSKIQSGLIELSDLYSIKSMLKNYIQYLRSGAVANIFALEKLCKVEVKGVPIWMKMDRIDRIPENGYSIIDYKTSKAPSSKKEELSSVQIPSYGLWIRQDVSKKAKIEGSYFYLRHILGKGIHTHKVTDEWMEITIAKYFDVYYQIQNGCSYAAIKNAKNCNWCDFRLPCSSNFGLKK